LTLYDEAKPILVFEVQSDDPMPTESTIAPEDPVSVVVTAAPTPSPVFEPPEGFNRYQDPVTDISVYIPENWIVTGIVEGEYAILQSYPEDKYVGGERREPGDTKCDLSVRPVGATMDEMISQWRSNEMTTIVSEELFEFSSGLVGKRFEIDNMGRATVFITEINQRVVLLTCFGDFSFVDDIAATLGVLE
jgi:hypothetical protein